MLDFTWLRASCHKDDGNLDGSLAFTEGRESRRSVHNWHHHVAENGVQAAAIAGASPPDPQLRTTTVGSRPSARVRTSQMSASSSTRRMRDIIAIAYLSGSDRRRSNVFGTQRYRLSVVLGLKGLPLQRWDEGMSPRQTIPGEPYQTASRNTYLYRLDVKIGVT